MEHEEQKDPVAQFTSAHSTTSAVDLSDRDNKENLVVKEEGTYDAGAFKKVEAEVARPKTSQSTFPLNFHSETIDPGSHEAPPFSRFAYSGTC